MLFKESNDKPLLLIFLSSKKEDFRLTKGSKEKIALALTITLCISSLIVLTKLRLGMPSPPWLPGRGWRVGLGNFWRFGNGALGGQLGPQRGTTPFSVHCKDSTWRLGSLVETETKNQVLVPLELQKPCLLSQPGAGLLIKNQVVAMLSSCFQSHRQTLRMTPGLAIVLRDRHVVLQQKS